MMLQIWENKCKIKVILPNHKIHNFLHNKIIIINYIYLNIWIFFMPMSCYWFFSVTKILIMDAVAWWPGGNWTAQMEQMQKTRASLRKVNIVQKNCKINLLSFPGVPGHMSCQGHINFLCQGQCQWPRPGAPGKRGKFIFVSFEEKCLGSSCLSGCVWKNIHHLDLCRIYDLDQETCPRYCQAKLPCQILGPVQQWYRQQHRWGQFYLLDHWQGWKVK